MSGTGPCGGRLLSLLAGGPSDQQAHQSEGGAIGAQSSGRPSPHGPAAYVLLQLPRMLPSSSQDHGEPRLRHPAMDNADSKPQCRKSEDVHDPGPLGTQCLLAPDRVHNAPSQSGSITACQAGGQDDQGALSPSTAVTLALSLINPHNYCYSHATVLSICWTVCCLTQGMQILEPGLLRLLRWLTRKPQSVHLWNLRAWTQLCRDWQAPQSQHDVAEFLQFLSPALHSTAYGWEAREGISGACFAEVVDQAQLCPLVMPIALDPAMHRRVDPVSLQTLFICWRNQASQHAAVKLPPWFAVQLCRFDAAGHKVQHRISLHPHVYVPEFVGPGYLSTSRKYEITAVMYHLGNSKDSGHYRAALFSNGELRHVTDDGIAATEATEQDRDTVSRNAYVCFLRQMQSQSQCSSERSVFGPLLVGRDTPIYSYLSLHFGYSLIG